MDRRRLLLWLAVVALPLLLPVPAQAQQAWIVDILANPSRYWNRTVTLTGQVQNVNANPAGTTRGTYTLLDESCPNPITVRTSDLPPVGRTYAVTGVVMQDPTSGTGYLKEMSRSEPGMSSLMLYSLIAAGIVFLGLLILFIVMLLRPKRTAVPPAQAPIAVPPRDRSRRLLLRFRRLIRRRRRRSRPHQYRTRRRCSRALGPISWSKRGRTRAGSSRCTCL
jgi:hypothetical protein